MALYAIGDLHLSLGSDKPMDVFGGAWVGYVDKLREGLSVIGPEDTTVLLGDLSWALDLNGAREDFAMIAAILPYIMLNLGILGRRYKVFMGDAGSTMIGFTIIWILLETTQGKTHPISPVTALWIIAIPLMDMVAIMYRRLRKGMSPFSPDRQHIHHLIMRAGFTSRQAFVLITLAAALLALVGVAAEYTRIVPEWVMLILFLVAFFLYGYCIKRAWKVARMVKRIRRRIRRHSGNNPN